MIRKRIDVSIKALLNKIILNKALDCSFNLEKLFHQAYFVLTKPHEMLTRNERERGKGG